MQQLEHTLDEMLVKKAPFQLPEGVRQGLVKVLPWLTLLGGALTLLGVWGLFQAATLVDRWAGVASELGVSWGVGTYVAPSAMTPLLWVSLVILLAEAILFFVAFPALQKYQKKGWNILFWVSLVNIAQGIVQTVAYANVYFNFGTLLMSVLSTLLGLYLLFQIRAYYTGEKKLSAAPTPTGGTTPPASTTPKQPAAKPGESTTPDKKA
jgi:hypothetical protein